MSKNSQPSTAFHSPILRFIGGLVQLELKAVRKIFRLNQRVYPSRRNPHIGTAIEPSHAECSAPTPFEYTPAFRSIRITGCLFHSHSRESMASPLKISRLPSKTAPSAAQSRDFPNRRGRTCQRRRSRPRVFWQSPVCLWAGAFSWIHYRALGDRGQIAAKTSFRPPKRIASAMNAAFFTAPLVADAHAQSVENTTGYSGAQGAAPHSSTAPFPFAKHPARQRLAPSSAFRLRSARRAFRGSAR